MWIFDLMWQVIDLFKKQHLNMLVVFSTIFVAGTIIFCCYNFVAPLKRDSGTGIFLWILRNFYKNTIFIEHLRLTASNHPRAKAIEIISKSNIVIREVASLGKWKTCRDYDSLTKMTKENADIFPKFLFLLFNNSIIKMEVPTFPNLLHIVPLFKKVWRAPEAVG